MQSVDETGASLDKHRDARIGRGTLKQDIDLGLLDRRIRRIEDQLAIYQLVVSYGPTVDSGQSAAAGRLWAEDGIYESDLFKVTGPEAIAGLMDSALHQSIIMEGGAHDMSIPYVEIDGDTAVATNYAKVYRREGGAFKVWRVVASRWECVRTDAGWHIKSRINRLLDGAASARELLGAARNVKPWSK